MIPCKTKLKTFITFLKFKRASSQNLNLVQLLDFLETVEDRFLEIHGVLVSELKAKIHDHFKITEIANNKAAFNACLAKCLNRFLVGALSVIVKLQTSRRFISNSTLSPPLSASQFCSCRGKISSDSSVTFYITASGPLTSPLSHRIINNRNRAGHEPSRSLKFHNHGEGPF